MPNSNHSHSNHYHRGFGGSVSLPHRTFDEHAYQMGYPSGNLSGLNWGVYDHYGIHARVQKKGTHLVDRSH